MQTNHQPGNHPAAHMQRQTLRVIPPHRNVLARCPTKKGPVTLKHFQTSTERDGKASRKQAIFKANRALFGNTLTAAESR